MAESQNSYIIDMLLEVGVKLSGNGKSLVVLIRIDLNPFSAPTHSALYTAYCYNDKQEWCIKVCEADA